MHEGEKSDLINLIRSQWFSAYMWLAGISIFLITISFAIVPFSGVYYPKVLLVPLCIMLVFLFGNLWLSIWMIFKGLSFYHEMWKTYKYGDIPHQIKFESYADKEDKTIATIQKWIKVTFSHGLGLFWVHMVITLMLFIDP